MTFEECCIKCVGNKELVDQFNRLTGHKLGMSMKRTPVERIIDKSCGYNQDTEAFPDFCRFVEQFVWNTLDKDIKI